MLSKEHRLTDKLEITEARTAGKRYFGLYTTCFITKAEEKQPTRFAFVVSKRVSNLAVERNRTRRLLREAVKNLLPSVLPGYTVLCVAKTSLFEVPLQAIASDMSGILKKARLLR